MIQVKNLNKVFKVHKKAAGFKASIKSLFTRDYIKKHALRDINLTIEEGEIIGLIGSNGAGKTTLAKILSGIIHPTSGEVSVIGFNPWIKNNEFRSKMSLIMGQKAQLWWDLPALDGFLLLKEIYKIPDDHYNEMIDYLSEKLQIKEELKIQIRKLSLGQRMKVELMAALLHRPKVVFLDEPTIGLDLFAQTAIRNFIVEYRKKYKPIMILTSHYMEDIERLCERVVIMKEGLIIFDGNIDEIKNKYGKNKSISFKIQEESFNPKILKTSYVDFTQTGNFYNFEVPEANISIFINEIIDSFKVEDLSISRQDISTIIESILGN
ncbi:MAG: ATP-binding cassette domain-containing protein [Bacteriovoracaceae bacterium]|jgi:ABC-2 type transport system ATP-binding protein|nr:ATP-binding cassette domain-containing protein [Bacteriovoracaceae bacterium]